MAGQKNCTEQPDSPRIPPDDSDFDLLALIARLVEGPNSAADPDGDPAAVQRLSPAAIGRLLGTLVEQTLPAGLVVTTLADYEHARERAYAQGWQDAVQHTVAQIPAQAGSREPDPDDDGTVLAFPPRIPLVRAADTSSGHELMPHRPRRSPRAPKSPKTPGS